MERINVNWNDLSSIQKAEQQKAVLENRGFKVVQVLKDGFFKDILILKECA